MLRRGFLQLCSLLSFISFGKANDEYPKFSSHPTDPVPTKLYQVDNDLVPLETFTGAFSIEQKIYPTKSELNKAHGWTGDWCN